MMVCTVQLLRHDTYCPISAEIANQIWECHIYDKRTIGIKKTQNWNVVFAISYSKDNISVIIIVR